MSIETVQEFEPEVLPYFGDDYRRRSLEALARRYVVGETVLDLRCVTGTLAVDLAASGFEVVAFDGHTQGVAMANEAARARELPPVARVWNFKDLPSLVEGRRFDTVLCLDLLLHVDDDQETAGELATVLADGGRLILTAPAFPSLRGRRDETQGHMRRYTRSALRDLLTSNGIEIDLMRYWNFSALPLYTLIEKGLRMRLSDRVRYMRGRPSPSPINAALHWWYTKVENRLLFPCGMTHFVVGRPRA